MIPRRDAFYIFLGWTILSLAAGVQSAFGAVVLHRPEPWAAAFWQSCISWAACAAFTPVFFVASSRWPLGKTPGTFVWIAYAALVSVCSVLKFVLWIPINNALFPQWHYSLAEALSDDFVFQFFAFSAVVGILLALVYYRSFRDRELRAGQLEASLSRAQLDSLRVQLQPHFLFNTLNSIATLMHRDVEAADEMLARISDLLRLTLERGAVQEVTLVDELDLLERYVDIMRVRFRDRLVVDVEADEAALACPVPHFILQPLMENAIEHGIDRVLGICTVRLEARLGAGGLRIAVSDHGPGFDGGKPVRAGIGISNTRARLAALYGDAASVDMQPGESGGLTVTLRLPVRAMQTL